MLVSRDIRLRPSTRTQQAGVQPNRRPPATLPNATLDWSVYKRSCGFGRVRGQYGFEVDGFGAALMGSVVITIVSWLVSVILPGDDD